MLYIYLKEKQGPIRHAIIQIYLYKLGTEFKLVWKFIINGELNALGLPTQDPHW